MLPKLTAVKKFVALIPKKTTMKICPATIGKMPRFPERRFEVMRAKRPGAGSAACPGCSRGTASAALTRGLRRSMRCPRPCVELGGDRRHRLSCWVVARRSNTPTFRPSRSTVIRSAVSKMSWRLCEMITTARPCSPSRRTSASTCSVCATPRAAVGSSRMTSFEFHCTALATATDCRWPPERVATGRLIDGMVVTASDFRVAAVFCSITASSRICQWLASRPRYMFWTTVRLSQRARSW